jgi:hypothetical protein
MHSVMYAAPSHLVCTISGHRRRSDLLMKHPDGGQVGAGLEVMVPSISAIDATPSHLVCTISGY